jgi:flagellum-specific peptidoglycan hydrolase FlgJ
MANKTKSDYDKMSNDDLVAYLDKLDLKTFNSLVDGDTKVRYFIYKYGKEFAEALKGTNLFYAGVLAQSMFESGYGRSDKTQKANNFAGVKYNSKLHPDFYQTKSAKWAKFPTAKEGINNHIDTLMLPRYQKARLTAKSPEEQIKMIVQAGYDSTPPNDYVNFIKGNIRRVQNKVPIGKIV